MKLCYTIVAVLATTLLAEGIPADEDFIREDLRGGRVARQTSADQMVQNILKWLQGVYTQQSRRSRFADYQNQNLFNFASGKLDDAFRQGTLREYLPPTNTQKPRPFETARPPGGEDINDNYINGGGYPPAGSITPQPPFPIFTRPATGGVTGDVFTPTIGYPQTTFPDQGTPTRPGYPTVPTAGTSGYPTPPFPTHAVETPSPGGFTGYPDDRPTPGTGTEPSTQPPATSGPTEAPETPTQGTPTVVTGYPEAPTGTQPPPELTSIRPGFPTQPPPGLSTGYPERPTVVTQPPTELTTMVQAEIVTQPATGAPAVTTGAPVVTTGAPTQQPEGTETTATPGRLPTEGSVVETEAPISGPSTETSQSVFTSATTPEEEATAPVGTTESPEAPVVTTEGSGVGDDSSHPPHIHNISVECGKDMMTITVEFNREFDGVVYSKGFYNMPECRYVTINSGQTRYSFTVNLNQCGTQFKNAFDTEGQSYLENVLVFQNEDGIQEVWDTVRAVRCLWQGTLKQSLNVKLSVGMLSQELVTFSGDTALVKLNVLLGRGPLGEPANGLVKIGEPMTLVVSVSEDPGFDIQVKDCRAVDSTEENTIPLTDEDGCILKPKLFGAFQKTRSTGDTGASIIAYAYFNAFKFPDVMDLMIKCNVELCKTDCEVCTNPDQKLEPGRRRRRDLRASNDSLHDGVTMGKHLRIILPEDLSDGTVIDLGRTAGVCMSTQSFVFSTSLLISLLTASCLFSAFMWLKTQQLRLVKK